MISRCVSCLLNVSTKTNGLTTCARIARSLERRCHLATSAADRDKTVVSKDGSTIYCWHPEQGHPYEHTRPVPRVEEEIREGDSVLKAQYLLADKYRFRPDGPTDPELTEMFSTYKWHFRLKPARRFAKENPPVDREGI